MVLCDTNIFISAFNGREDTIINLEKIGFENIILSSITVMELYQGMGNKEELAKMKKRIKFYDIIHIDEAISAKSVELISNYKLSHHLQIPDAIIAANSLVKNIPLYTYNIKDFDYIDSINLYSI
jgi:hypothetical protein